MQPLDNPKHEAFANAMAMGRTLSEALVAGNYKPHPPSASRLLKKAKISERIAYLKSETAKERDEALREFAKKEILTRQWVIENLMRNAKICMGVEATPDGHQPAGANKALELLGKELGMFVERVQSENTHLMISDDPVSEDEWKQEYATAH